MKNATIYAFVVTFLLSLMVASAVSAQVDVPRRTTAATYPLDELVNIQFRGTTRFPRMKGEARVKRTGRNGTQIELGVTRMPRPFELGVGYATYILWAISPDGQVSNLGEIKRRGFFEFDFKINVTTPLQTFAMIITAEPHFLVRRPSQAIMLENLNPYSPTGKTVSTTSTVQYFGNSSDYFRDPRTPEIAEFDYAKTPSAILQAKQAVALAKFAGAERDAATELTEATVLLENAELGWKSGRKEELVDIDARKAVGAAVKAESTAMNRKDAREKRNEKARSDAETRQAEERFTSAQNQLGDLKEELARETRNRELAERDALNYSNQVKELQGEIGRLREELGRAKLDAETSRAKLSAVETEKQAAEGEREKQTKIERIRSAEGELITALKRFGQVSRVDKSIVLVMPSSIWQTSRSAAFAGPSDAKLSSLAQILSSNEDYSITIESHSDDAGDPNTLQSLTDNRAKALSDKFSSLGVAESRMRAKGFGGTIPAVPNTSVANKAANRRVNIILDLTME